MNYQERRDDYGMQAKLRNASSSFARYTTTVCTVMYIHVLSMYFIVMVCMLESENLIVTYLRSISPEHANMGMAIVSLFKIVKQG